MKKRVLATVIAMILIVMGSSAYGATEIVWWDFLSGGDGVRMKALIKKFNDTHPDIQIKPTTLEWGNPYYTKVQTATAVGEQPDVMTYHLSRLPLAVSQNLLRPISDEELESAGLSKEDFLPVTFKSAQIKDTTYAIPFDTHSLILYYNKDLLKEADLLDDNGLPKGLDGVDNFNAALKKLTSGKAEYALAIHNDRGDSLWRIFYSLIAQQGEGFIEGKKVLAGDAGKTAMEVMRTWVVNKWAPELTTYPASIALFTSGKAAMHFNGVWEVPTMADLAAQDKLGFEWGAVQIPSFFGKPGTWADSHAFAIPDSKKKPISDEKLSAVLKVVAWMAENSLSWATAGHIPAFKKVVESNDYKQMKPNAVYSSLTETAVFDPQNTIAGVASPVYDAMGNYLVPAVNGQISVEEAIVMIKEELEPLL